MSTFASAGVDDPGDPQTNESAHPRTIFERSPETPGSARRAPTAAWLPEPVLSPTWRPADYSH
jgi:hypothetical protein